MKVNVKVQAIAGFPAPQGAHELSWSYILDAVFADAYHSELQSLEIILPSELLLAEAQLRAELMPPRQGASGHGLALLAGGYTGAAAERLYLLEFGRLAPKSLRRHNRHTVKTATSLSIFTWRARLLGMPIRLFAAMKRPDLNDRTMFRMRQVFASAHAVPAYYHLHLGGGEQ